MPLPIREPALYTYADIITTPEGERWELIDGVPYDMSPSPSLQHQRIVGTLLTQFGNFLEGKPCEYYTYLDVRLPKPGQDGITADTVVQPDVLVVCDREKLDERGCVGAPTLVVEITSPITMGKDLREKYALYQRVGVPEYWIIDPSRKTLQIYTLDASGRYGASIPYLANESAPVSVIPGLEIDLGRIFSER